MKRISVEAARFLALMAVGIAWAAPAYMAALFRHDPRVVLRPAILGVLAAIDTQLLFLAPVMAIIGVVVVSSLTGQGAVLDVASLMALVLVSALPVVVFMWAYANPAAMPLSLDSITQLLAVFGVLGAAYTVAALWSVNRVVASSWAVIVFVVVAVLWLGSERVFLNDREQVAGMRVFIDWIVIILVVWLSAVVAFIAQGLRNRDLSPLT
jgi:hypothetical protein